jgi:WD40 repeat protein
VDNATKSKIYTFYSYKGGVGRSMALANIAELLHTKGLSVLMIDFDLEAPGLEQYFFNPSKANEKSLLQDIWSKRGVIDLLFSYKSLRSLHETRVSDARAAAPTSTPASMETTSIRKEDADAFPFPKEPLENFVTEITPPSQANPARLSLITAGRRCKERINIETNQREIVDDFANYADRVRSFAWDDFYLNWDGERFFEWFRNEVISIADVVLIDSRTGVAEMSGVCTYQLADIAVMFVASNNQNVEGIKKIAESLENKELIKEGRKGRKLSLIFVPSRVDLGEKQQLDDLTVRFLSMTKTLISPSLTFVTDSFTDLKIPYITYYSFVEELAVRDVNSPAAIEMTKAYERICRSLGQLDPIVAEKLRVESDGPENINVAEQLNRSAEKVFAQLTPLEQYDAPLLFTRLVRLAQPEYGQTRDAVRNARLSELTAKQLEIAEKFIDQGLLILVHDTQNQPAIGLADERLFGHWDRLNDWMEKDREFLLWRQAFQFKVSLWETGGRRDSDLLLGSKYEEEAEKWLNARPTAFSDAEANYIRASAARAKQRKFRQRVQIISIMAGSVIFALWWFASSQRQTNEEARTQSRRLAVASQALLASQPTVSLALAMEAGRVSPTTQAQEALKSALQESNLHTVIAINANPNSARFSHDAKKIVAGFQNGEVALWQSENGDWKSVRRWNAHKGEVVAAIFSPDDQVIATAGYDGRAILWDANSGQMIHTFTTMSGIRGTPATLLDICFSRDGSVLAGASSDNRVYVWDIKSGQPAIKLGIFNGDVRSVDLSDEYLVATDGNEVAFWSVKGWQKIPVPIFNSPVLCARFSNNALLVTTHSDGAARVWSTKNWQSVTVFSEHKVPVTHANFSSDGKLVVTTGNDTSALIWESATGKLTASLRGALRTLTDASFSPDGKIVLTAEAAGVVRLWDVHVDVNPNSSLNELMDQGCARLTRNMTKLEWQQYVGAESYRATCSNLPAGDAATPQSTPENTTSP